MRPPSLSLRVGIAFRDYFLFEQIALLGDKKINPLIALHSRSSKQDKPSSCWPRARWKAKSFY